MLPDVHAGYQITGTTFVATDDGNITRGKINGYVSIFLKQSDFSLIFCRYPTGGYIGHTSALKLQAHIGNISMLADDRSARGMNAFDLRFDKVHNNIDVMDHKIKHDTDIGAAIFKNTQAMGFDKKRVVNNILERDHRRIKPLQVADLHNTFPGLGDLDQVIGLLQGCCHGLFNQHVQIMV